MEYAPYKNWCHLYQVYIECPKMKNKSLRRVVMQVRSRSIAAAASRCIRAYKQLPGTKFKRGPQQGMTVGIIRLEERNKPTTKQHFMDVRVISEIKP